MRSRLAFALVLLLTVPVGAPPAGALPLPGLFCDAALAATGRVFPEAMQTNDFVGFDEALCGLELLAELAPERIEVREIGRSYGWDELPSGDHVDFPVIAVEITNEESPIPNEDKVQLLFQLSVHGNEKDGREGGLRAIEDLARGIGMAEEHPELLERLDYELLIFTFPNPDGWVHEELQYRLSDPGNPLHYVRENGNQRDLNRQWPTVGWMRGSYTPFSEPEIVATHAYLQNFTNLKFATDIHGMLNPADGRFGHEALDENLGGGPESDGPRGHYLLTMIAAGRMDPHEWRRITALSELIKERVNANPEMAPWTALPTTGAWGGEANEWGMSVDAINYEDSGFTGDFFAQDSGLNVPDIDFEMSYNHILFDNYYPGAGQVVNAMAIACVRDIVRSMMDLGATDVTLSIETHGRRTLVVENPVVLTNAGNLSVGGWAEDNPLDNAFDTAHRVFEAAPADYWTDLQPWLRDGEMPGILDLVPAGDITAQRLAPYDRVVVPGTAARDMGGEAIAALKAWTEKGGRLVLTDSAMALLPQLGAAPEESVDVELQYTGAIDIVDREHPLVDGVRGLARQTYVAVPLGYSIETFSSPVWHVKSDAGGTVVALAGNDEAKAALGEVSLGAGSIVYFGAFLPDPTNEFDHPYGLDSYSATYTANEILRNALGFEEVYTSAPLQPETLGSQRAGTTPGATADDASVPGLPILALLAALAVVAVLRRR